MCTLFSVIIHCWGEIFPQSMSFDVSYSMLSVNFSKERRAASGAKDPHAHCVTLIISLKNKTDIQFR